MPLCLRKTLVKGAVTGFLYNLTLLWSILNNTLAMLSGLVLVSWGFGLRRNGYNNLLVYVLISLLKKL